MIRTREERIRSARESVVRLAKNLERDGAEHATFWTTYFKLERAVAYLNKLEKKRAYAVLQPRRVRK